MIEQKRLGGIDLFRGLAIYAVIVVHVDEAVKVLPPAWSQIHAFALFAVPFFLATAFYLAISKLYQSRSPYPLGSRLIRLLIPYGVWSVFYLLFKLAKSLASGERSQALSLFQDPLSTVFFGGTAFHLYFLPLLATGTLLIKVSEFCIAKKISLKGLGLITLLSLLVYEVVLASGNGSGTATYTAFQPLLAALSIQEQSNPHWRWLAVEVLWLLRCLPYVMIAMLIAYPHVHQRGLKIVRQYPLVWLLIFLIINAFSFLILPPATYELARGFTALIAAIAASELLQQRPFLKNLGSCSFGIYLIHLCLVEIFQSIAIRLYPNHIYDISSIVLLLVAVIILFISWGATALLMRWKGLSRILYGF